MNNRILLVVSLALNVVLSGVCLYGCFLKGNVQQGAASTDVSVTPVYQEVLDDDDIIFMGEARMGSCNWSMMMSNERCKTLAFRGNTLKSDIKRLDMLFKDVSPRKFFLMYGEQELLDGCEVCEISQEYDHLVAGLKERFPSTEFVLLTVLPMGRQGSNELNLAMTSRLNALNIFVRSIASRYGYPCVDMFKEFATPEGLLNPYYDTADGFHLNYSAYVMLKERIGDYVRN